MEADRRALLDAVRMIYEKGRGVTSRLYNRTYFTIAQTPEFMKKYGLIGNYFTIGYGVISHHISKDEAHRIPIDVWRRLPEALRTPFAITKYYKIEIDKNNGKKERGEFKGYNVYTAIKTGDAYVVVGVTVKNIGQNLEINSISTVFGRSKKGGFEDVLYRSEKITPEQSALLDETRPHRYPTIQEKS